MYTYKPEELLVYLRKSQSDDPAKTVEEVLAKHEAILQDFAVKIAGAPIPEQNIFREVVSGESISARVRMQSVLKLIESPDIKGVLVVDPQRLSRGDLVDCGTVINAFRYSATLLLTPSRSFDLSEKYDRKFMEMELQHGSDYLDYCKEILNRGRIASVMKGNYIAKDAPYGYRKVSYKEGTETIHTLEIISEEAAAIRMAYDLFINKGCGYANIAHALDEYGYRPRFAEHWSPAALKDMMENPVYTGKIRWNHRKAEKHMENGILKTSRPKKKEGCLLIDGRHKPIISIETYNAALERRSKNTRTKAQTTVRNPLSGILFCNCGRAMSYRTYKNTKTGICKSAPRLLCDNQVHCRTRSCTYDDMEKRVIHHLEDAIRDFKIQLKNTADSSSAKKDAVLNLQKRLHDLETKETRLWEKYTDEDMPRNIFDSLMEKVIKEKETVNQSLQTVISMSHEAIDYEERISRFTEALDTFRNPDIPAADKNILLKRCIEKIIYHRDSNAAPANKNGRTGRWSSSEIELDVFLRL